MGWKLSLGLTGIGDHPFLSREARNDERRSAEVRGKTDGGRKNQTVSDAVKPNTKS